MGFIIYYLVLIVNPMGRILVRWKSFRNILDMLCHPVCNWLYHPISLCLSITLYPCICIYNQKTTVTHFGENKRDCTLRVPNKTTTLFLSEQ